MNPLNDLFASQRPSVFIIAEAGVNHNGSLEMAKKMVDAAVESGVDAIKFQTFKAGQLVTINAQKALYQKETTGSGESQYEMLKRLELDQKRHSELIEYCKKRNIIFLSTPFDFESVELLEKLNIPAYKVSSGDITNLPFLEHIARKNKPVILSTGMAGLGEVEEAVGAVRKGGNSQIILLHCTSNYPTEFKDVNLKAMLTLKHAFQVPVGYSDHTLGIEVPIAAVALGASMIEKHFTLDRNLPGPDHRASLEPEELKAMVLAVRNVEKALGDGIKRCQDVEANVKETARKSIVPLKDLVKGEVLTREALGFKRPGTGLPPKFIDFLIGKKVRRDIAKDSIIALTDIE
ncbi:MAG: N-acetylneuraminate synthase [Firmicutes bacterium]|nr:N-acetylneuraminate synthase [Bacillota bacterium]